MEQKYIDLCVNALNNANENKSKLNNNILKMEGMSGLKTRHFYNNLLDNNFLTNYLEIGTWKGSSFISAMYNNNIEGYCIDNWSQFGGPKDDFHNNVKRFLQNNKYKIFDEDSFKFDVNKLPKIDIYMYDGDHTYQAQKDAITHYYNCFNDVFILVVDDWNWFDVQNGTRDGIKEKNIEVIWEKEIKYNECNAHTDFSIARVEFWNGIYIAVCKK